MSKKFLSWNLQPFYVSLHAYLHWLRYDASLSLGSDRHTLLYVECLATESLSSFTNGLCLLEPAINGGFGTEFDSGC